MRITELQHLISGGGLEGTVHRLVADLSCLPEEVFVCNRIISLALAADAVGVRRLTTSKFWQRLKCHVAPPLLRA